ncbi:MAG: MgtC/SapB family protein [Actinomycetota bacterium]|jgi:putative Mg2+ transporter-C (MgtC) family protein|nr:MgtC/SapB family protein [Actinomycetota bacterium]
MTLELGEATGRLVVAAILSGFIGFEREVAQKAAGLRTHMLVGLGAAVFSLLSVEAFAGSDPARVAAQVVTGIGFLGAGAIFRHGFTVRGLTTAAGLWSVAAVGMAAGIGEWQIAVLATAVSVVVLYVVGVVQWLVRGRRDEATTVIVIRMSDPAVVSDASEAARRLVEPGGDVIIHEIAADKASIQVTVEPKLADAIMVRLRALTGVERVTRVDG